MKYLVNLSLILLLALSSCSSDGKKANGKDDSSGEKVNVYTHRNNDADKELFAQFEKETGIKVNVVNDEADKLIRKIESEGESSTADVLITSDAGRLVSVQNKGLFQAINSEKLNSSIPVKYRDSEGHWYGLTKRARVFIYNPEMVSASDLSTYQDLAEPKWEGTIAASSSSSVYNQTLMASIIAHSNMEEATTWAKKLVSNLYADPSGDDKDQIKAAYNGDAKVAIANSYCLGLMRKSNDPEEKKIAKSMKIHFPNSRTTGTHVNISGGGVCKNAPNKDNAIKFLEFLASKEAQGKFGSANSEYPVNPEAGTSAFLMLMGDFSEDKLNLADLGNLNRQAIQAFDAVGWK
ncbi:MAG: extracellular solute-binding protein [Flavobacteriales bacterium]